MYSPSSKNRESCHVCRVRRERSRPIFAWDFWPGSEAVPQPAFLHWAQKEIGLGPSWWVLTTGAHNFLVLVLWGRRAFPADEEAVQPPFALLP